jgi:hypothetical protein
MLCLADGLDRSHKRRVRSIALWMRAGALIVRCRASGVPELELWAARKRLDPLGRCLGVPVKLELAEPEGRSAVRRLPVRR